MSPIELPILPFASQGDLADWLAENHNQSAGLWLKLAKKGTGVPSVTYGEAVEVALCYGWIDSQKKGFDESFWLQRFTPRKPPGIFSGNQGKTDEDAWMVGFFTGSDLRTID